MTYDKDDLITFDDVSSYSRLKKIKYLQITLWQITGLPAAIFGYLYCRSNFEKITISDQALSKVFKRTPEKIRKALNRLRDYHKEDDDIYPGFVSFESDDTIKTITFENCLILKRGLCEIRDCTHRGMPTVKRFKKRAVARVFTRKELRRAMSRISTRAWLLLLLLYAVSFSRAKIRITGYALTRFFYRSKSTVSKWLTELVKAGLVIRIGRGKHRIIRLIRPDWMKS